MRKPGKSLRAPRQFVQMCDQDSAGHGLDEIVVGSLVKDAGDDGWLVQGGKDENRNAAKRTSGLAYLPTVCVRHHQIQNDYSRGVLADHPKAILATVGNQHVKTVGIQEHGKEIGDGRIVVYRQDKGVHIFAHSLLSWICRGLNFADNLQNGGLPCDICHL
jgi:hypothetical protein